MFRTFGNPLHQDQTYPKDNLVLVLFNSSSQNTLATRGNEASKSSVQVHTLEFNNDPCIGYQVS